jgi:hypothetical protein
MTRGSLPVALLASADGGLQLGCPCTYIDRKGSVLKLRNLLLVGAGIGLGYALSQKLHEDDPDVVHGPRRATRSSSVPGLSLVKDQAARLGDQAAVRSLDAIRRTRGAIRDRLGEADQEDTAWT